MAIQILIEFSQIDNEHASGGMLRKGEIKNRHTHA